jgi:hypothetical protein
MSTTEITIGALSLISTGFATFSVLKYWQMKEYYRLKSERYNSLNEHFEDLQAKFRDILADNNRKSDKVKKKDEQIYNQSIMIKDMEIEINDLIITNSEAGKEIDKLNNIINYFQVKMQGNKRFNQLVKDLKGGEE